MQNYSSIARLSSLREIPSAVWALGFVSLLMDVSSEIIHALLPVYLVTVLGASMLTVGFIEGIAEAAASITKVFSGALSDKLGKRKLLAIIGYGLAAFTKPIFPLASAISWHRRYRATAEDRNWRRAGALAQYPPPARPVALPGYLFRSGR